jgi:hypothetical protein
MLNLYESNERAAEERYKGVLVRINGLVKDIDGNKIEIIPSASDMFQQSGARCYVKSSDDSKISGLEQRGLSQGRLGSQITIRGVLKEFSHFAYTVAKIENCQINPGPEALSGEGSAAQMGSSGQYVEGLGSQHPILPADHITEGVEATYNSVPPTSGEHWPTPARCGFYEEGLPDERVVHNMEHGNIVISYNLTLESEVSALRSTLGNIGLNSIWGVARAYDQIPSGQVILSTWGVSDTLLEINENRIKRFFETYAGNLGPEQIPC